LKKFGRWLWRYAGSLQLAVIIILGLAFIAGWGTITEATYNTETAQKLVYHSVYMYSLMIFLIVNLVVSALHRWPWQKRHIGFVVAHVGIIILLVGSEVTKQKGIDGSMVFGIGERNRYVSINQTELGVYIPVGDGNYMPLVKKDVDFLVRPPNPNQPFELATTTDKIEVVDYYPYAGFKTTITESQNNNEGVAARFQISSSRVNMTEWVQQAGTSAGVLNLGPARVVVSTTEVPASGENEIILQPHDSDQMKYVIRSARAGGSQKTGMMKIGDVIDTGWMDMRFRLLNYYPHSTMKNEFQKLERPTPISTSAIKIRVGEQEHWLGLNATLKLFSDEAAYLISYGMKRLDLGFNIQLKDFKIGRYEGTNRAATYESDVLLEGQGDPINISMNEPMVHNNFTFYQASFQEGPDGKPTASILSVNYDPGRWLKYLGSLLIVLGSIIMFYFRTYLLKRSANEGSNSKAA
jgi:hypothetical protein